jgi:hypothetical protein
MDRLAELTETGIRVQAWKNEGGRAMLSVAKVQIFHLGTVVLRDDPEGIELETAMREVARAVSGGESLRTLKLRGVRLNEPESVVVPPGWRDD